MRVVVLASGRGSNLAALIRAIDDGTCAAEIVAVVSDRPKAGALKLAAQHGIATETVPLKKGDDRAVWDKTLTQHICAFEPALLVLAGFMRIVGQPLLRAFPRRIINVHPSLLPAFPGHDGPQQALEAGVRLSGCTVHIVDEGVDTGPILAQASVPVLPGDDAALLHQRIQAVEHRLLPNVVHQIACGTLSLHF